MRTILLAGALLAALVPAAVRAQTAEPPAATQTAAAAASPAAAADSAVAVGNLFRQRRTGGAVLTAIGGAFTLAIIRGVASGESSGNAAGVAASIAVLGVVPAGVGVSKSARFSRAREAEVLQAYQQGKPLPKAIRRRLKRKHFGQ